MNARRIQLLFCEALREGGLLVVVFASIDGAFGVSDVDMAAIVIWGVGGMVLLVLGILLDPEVRQ